MGLNIAYHDESRSWDLEIRGMINSNPEMRDPGKSIRLQYKKNCHELVKFLFHLILNLNLISIVDSQPWNVEHMREVSIYYLT